MFTPWKLTEFNQQVWRIALSANAAETKKVIDNARHKFHSTQKAALADPTHAITDQLLNAPESVIAARVRANSKLDLDNRERLDACLKPFSLEQLSSEPIRVFAKKKSKGGFRVVSVFGPLHKTAQELVAGALTPKFQPPPFLYGLKKRGGQQAIAIAKTFIGEGYVWVARLDIKRCFDSFTDEELVKVLPLPAEWVESVVCRRHSKTVLGYSHSHSQYDDDVLMGAHLGIPTGSGCSPLVCAYCVAQLPWQPTEDVKLILYVDDLLILAKSHARLQQEMASLTNAVENIPGGHFTSSILHEGHIEYGISFLGHILRLNGSKLETDPSDAALARLHEHAEYLPDPKFNDCAGITLQMLARTWSHIRGWRAAFSQCDDVDSWVELVRSRILAVAARLEIAEEALNAVAAKHPFEFDFSGFS
jgi:hypothetical protein